MPRNKISETAVVHARSLIQSVGGDPADLMASLETLCVGVIGTLVTDRQSAIETVDLLTMNLVRRLGHCLPEREEKPDGSPD